MKAFGKDISSARAWEEMAAAYSGQLQNAYHRHRLAVIHALIPEDLYREGKHVLDFGCGDAVLFERFLSENCTITGIDTSPQMIAAARQRLSSLGRNSDVVKAGGAQDLAELADDSLDAILSFNVLAYLTDDQEDLFYRQAFRLLRVGGYLIVTHSNELFDMFSLNRYTAIFFERHLINDVSLRSSVKRLIANSSSPDTPTSYNVRENPLAYRHKLHKYGFTERRQEFINLHVAPPPLLSDAKVYPDTLSWSESERWKLLFTCSTFGSLSVREEGRS